MTTAIMAVSAHISIRDSNWVGGARVRRGHDREKIY
jgi:hypothetical protein